MVSRQLNQVWLHLHGAQAVALCAAAPVEPCGGEQGHDKVQALADAAHTLIGLAIADLAQAEVLIARGVRQ